jgi:LysR family transcriptional regulator (chromosome initiation inhibitor)
VLDYDLLRALAAVVREGSFEGAAQTLSVTPSAISQRIKLLEMRIGAILIVRGRPCTATTAGFQLFRHIELVQVLEHDLVASLRSEGSTLAGEHVKIRIAVNADSISTWFSKVVARAGAELEVLFDIVPDDQEYTAEYLRKGEALAAVTADAVPVHGFRIVNIGTLDYVPAATPEFIKSHFPDGINPKGLDESPSILFDRKDSISYQWIKTTFNSSAKLTPHYVPSFSGYLQACLDGVGWGLVPEIAARPYLKNGALVELQPGTNVKVPLHWQYSVNAGQTMRALSMIVMDVARGELMSDQPSHIQ